jgi:outer membrane protein assembly factor BamB
LTTAPEDGTKLHAVAIDANSGKVIHDIVVFEVSDPEYCHPTNSYASCTPAIENGRVFVHFGSYGTACLDTSTGKVIWKRTDLPCDHFRGPASSPILHGDLLYVNFDGVDVQYVVALEKSTGKTRWKTDRSTDFGNVVGDFKKAYATPTVINVQGRELLVSPGAVSTMAYDAKTGEEVWQVRHGGMNAACRPIFAHGLVYLCAGADRNSLIVVKPDQRGLLGESAIAWRSSRNIPQRATPVIVGELMFMVNDNGIVSCVDAKTGATHFRERLKTGTYWASPIVADDRLYLFSKEGPAFVLAADRRFKVLASNLLETGCNATPLVLGDSLIVRTVKHLYRIEK